MASTRGPAARTRDLESAITTSARGLGTTVRRYRDAFNRTMLLMTLHRAMAAGVLDDYHLKGGAAIEVRHGFDARATQDIDIEIPVSIDAIVQAFATAIAVGCDDFTFELRGDPRRVREDAVSVTVSMRYLGRGWGTLDVDLAPAQPGDVAETLPLTTVEFPDVAGEVRTMKTEFQIAQKIHAITMPDPPGHPLRYARHVVDVLYLVGTGVDPAMVAAACEAVFDARSAKDGRSWPPDTILLPERWIADYHVTLNGYGMTIPAEDVPRAFTTFVTSLIG